MSNSYQRGLRVERAYLRRLVASGGVAGPIAAIPSRLPAAGTGVGNKAGIMRTSR